MNLQKVREIEIRHEAQNLLVRIIDVHCLKDAKETNFARDYAKDPYYKHYLKGSGPIGGRYSPQSPPELLPIINIVKAHVRGTRFQESDLEAVHRLLNKRIVDVFYSNVRDQWFIVPKGPRVRFAAEELLRYLKHSAEYGASGDIPIGLCPNCDGLFLKQKANQKHCRDLCRAEGWTAGKRKTDPDYFNRLARYRRNRHRISEGK